ncbi:DUF11 domain-containing protein [Lacihabitans soyangensis]|uniref:DUF11 domain-containing protein n=1 Tax=Lacihabitans soyangensis TaxID=869394 RepID=A0AAE3KQQ3_9BACT|nr:DUF11 domain-containing protein [Lacihabitans soyangensis]MCP9761318.1 DUF11 domain-containing protein [Lacihabitans soyangensis]
MENNYLKTRFASVFERDRKMWTQILLLGFLMLFAHLSTYAQPCNPDLAMTITTYDASAETVSDAKIRISGITNGNYKVGYSAGATYSGPGFAALGLYSALTNGFIAETLAAPSAAPGTQYTVRVFNETGSCFTDSTFYLPYVNYNYAPTYVDLEATITRSPAGDVPLGSSVTLTVAVRNNGTLDATGVVYQIGSALDLTMTANSTATGTYVPGTGVWTIGALNAGQTVSLTLTYTVNSRGIKEITAEATALDQIDLDSTPTANPENEDDEAQICITTHRDFCNGDEYTFALVNGNYTGVVWQRSTDNGTTWTTISGSTPNYEIAASGALIIKSVGDYKYYRDSSATSCGYEGCCPIKVIPGLPPILTTPTNEVICFGQPSPAIASTNTQTGYTATDHTLYGISTPITGFLADQGVFKYQWYNNNGPSNNNTNAIPGDSTLALETFPTAAGIYNYRLISVQAGHTSCTDTVDVEFRINETPVAFASSNTPICAEDTIELFSRNDAVNNPINPFGPASFQWWGPDSFTSSDSVTTRLNATEAMEGNYFVRAYYTLNGRVCADTISIPVVINPLPDKPNGIDTTYCRYIAGKRLSAILSVPVIDHTGDSLRWYEASSLADVYAITDKPDTTSLIGYNVGPYADTDEAPGQYKWWVTTVDALGCQSHIDSVIITIRDKPVLPVVRDLAFCQNYPSVPLTATTSTGGVYGLIWYGEDKSVIPGDTAATFPAPATDSVGTFTFWVSQFDTVTGCQSDTADFDVFIKDTPDGPAVVEPTYCLNETPVPLIATPVITNTVSNALNTLTWYWNGTTSGTAPTPPTTLPGASWAYVSQTTLYELPGVDTLNCESPQSPLKITVNPLPVASVIPVSALCIGTISQNNGMLIVTRYRDTDQAAFNIGGSFTAPGTFAVIPATGIISPAAGLPNPTGASQDYTVRIKNFHPGGFECFIDVTVPLVKKDCTCPGGYCEPAVVTKTK